MNSAQCEWVHIYLCGIMGNERDIERGRGIERVGEKENDKSNKLAKDINVVGSIIW